MNKFSQETSIETKQEKSKKNKKKTIIYWIIIILIIILLLLMGYLYFFFQEDVNIALNVSETQTPIDSSTKFRVLNKKVEDEYIELVGYGLLEINSDNPNVYLENPKDNNAYLQFDIVYHDNTLFSSDLIEPGNMEAFNIYECLDAGQYSLSYMISAYHMDTKKAYWSGVEQIQEININK